MWSMLEMKGYSMNKSMIALLLLLPCGTYLEATKKDVFDSIEELRLDKVRHYMRHSEDMKNSKVSEEDLAQFIGFTKEIMRDCKEEMQSVFKSNADLRRLVFASLGGLVGVAISIASLITLVMQPDRRIVGVGAFGTLVGTLGTRRAILALTCPHARLKLQKAQKILSYIEGFGKYEQPGEEEKAKSPSVGATPSS